MTEAEIAALVAKAVADYEANKSWGEELIHESETILTLIGMLVLVGVFLVRTHIAIRLRLQGLEDYRKTHEAADKAAHDALERETGHVVTELREFRKESSEQHTELAGKVSGMARDLNRLIGFHEAVKEKNER